MKKILVILLLCALILGMFLCASVEPADAAPGVDLLPEFHLGDAPLAIEVPEIPPAGIETGATMAAAVNMHRATRTWSSATTKNWSDVTGWDGGTTVPVTTDAIVFSSTGVGNCNIDNLGTWSGGTITVQTSYTGTVTQSVALVAAAYSQTATTSNTWNTNGSAFTCTTFALVSGTFTQGASTITTGAVTFSGGTLNATSGTWGLGGSWTQSGATSTFNANAGTINVTATGTITDTRSTFNKFTINAGAGVAIASGTTCPLGANPTTNVGGSQVTNNGTITYSGLWTNAGGIATGASSTTTGSASPSLALTLSLTLNATSTWTSVAVNCTGTAATTYTDTAAKNSGTWTINKTNAAFTVAASTSCSIGTTPSTSTGTSTMTVTGTLTYAGTWTHTGNITVSATTGTVTGSSTPALVLANSGSINLQATVAGWTSVNITVNGNGAAATYTDTTAKNTGTWTFSSTSSYTISASTSMSAGTNPSWTFGSNGAGISCSGTLTWAGSMTFSGSLTVTATGTVTTSSTPTFSISGSSLILTSGATWNATMPITFNGAIAGQTLTATANTVGTVTINQTGASSLTVSASTTCPLGTTPTSTCGTGTLTVNGTLTYAGVWTHTGSITTGASSTVTGSATPSIVLNQSLTLNSTSTWTSVNVTANGTASGTYTDTGAKNSGTWTINKGTGGGFTIAASTAASIGTNPTTAVGTGGSNIVIAGTLTYAAAWSHSGGISVSSGGTVTGSSTPSLSVTNDLTINSAASGWTSVNITTNGTSLATTYTDTGAKNSGTWTISKTTSGAVTVAASTTMALGSSPTSTTGSSTFTAIGTVTWASLWTHTGNIAGNAGGTLTGSSTPLITVNGNLTISTTTTITNAIGTITFNGAGTSTLTDTGDKLSGSTFALNKTNSFTIAASTICRAPLNASWTIGTGSFVVTGTLTCNGTFTITANLISVGAAGVVNGSPSLISFNKDLTITAGGTWPATTPITVTSTSGTTITATANTFGTFTVSKGGGGFSIAAGTSVTLGSNPTSDVGTASCGVTGTLTYSGLWTHTGDIRVLTGGTVTGSVSPSISVTRNLTIDAGATSWTSVNVLATGTVDTIYTDTLARNTGIWTVTKTNANWTVSASTIANLGANPTTVTTTANGTNLISLSGTLQFSGNWTHSGLLTVNAGATLTGTSSPTFTISDNLTFDTAATLTNAIPSITVTEGPSTFALSDAGDRLSGSTYYSLKTGATISGVTVSAPGTVMRLGVNPSWIVGQLGGTFIINASTSVVYSGTWSLNGPLSAAGTITGTASPVLVVTEGAADFGSATLTNPIGITMNQTSANTRILTGGSKTYTNFSRTGAGTGQLNILGSNTFTGTFADNLALATHTLNLESGSTTTFNAAASQWMIDGGGTGTITVNLNTSTPGVAAVLHAVYGKPINLRSCSIRDITVDALPVWWAGPNCTSVSGNTRINFAMNPALRPRF